MRPIAVTGGGSNNGPAAANVRAKIGRIIRFEPLTGTNEGPLREVEDTRILT